MMLSFPMMHDVAYTDYRSFGMTSWQLFFFKIDEFKSKMSTGRDILETGRDWEFLRLVPFCLISKSNDYIQSKRWTKGENSL